MAWQTRAGRDGLSGVAQFRLVAPGSGLPCHNVLFSGFLHGFAEVDPGRLGVEVTLRNTLDFESGERFDLEGAGSFEIQFRLPLT